MQPDYKTDNSDDIEIQEGSLEWEIAERLKETSGYLESVNNRPNNLIYSAFSQLPKDVQRLLRVYMKHFEFPSNADISLPDSLHTELHRLMSLSHTVIYYIVTELPLGDKPHLLKKQLGRIRGMGLNIKGYVFKVGMLDY
jgi:hypothetical protein